MRAHPFSVPVLLLAALTPFATGGVCHTSSGGPPEPDTCTVPSTDGVDAIEVDEGAQPGIVPLVRGPQGGSMIPVLLRVTGAAPPACLGVTVVVLDDAGEEMSLSKVPLRTYADGAGAAITRTVWLEGPFRRGQAIRLRAEVAAHRVERALFVGEVGVPCGEALDCYVRCSPSDFSCVNACTSGLALARPSTWRKLVECDQARCVRGIYGGGSSWCANNAPPLGLCLACLEDVRRAPDAGTCEPAHATACGACSPLFTACTTDR